jgi:hypothetical protein
VEPVVTAAGLDPQWSGAGWSGEALLGPPGGSAARVPGDSVGSPGEAESFG